MAKKAKAAGKAPKFMPKTRLGMGKNHETMEPPAMERMEEAAMAQMMRKKKAK